MFHLVYGFLYLLSLLPLWALYFIGDGFYVLAYYIIGYRKKVVLNNLLIAFPEKTQAERNRIAKKFYHNLIDNFIETIKMISASNEFLEKRFTGNWEVLNEIYATGRSCQVHLGHTFNWEWGNSMLAKNTKYKVLIVYMPISSSVIDKLFYKLRTRNGSHLLPATTITRALLPHRKSQYLLTLAADQNPGDPSRAYWVNFFGKPTPFLTGPEKGAVASNLPVFFTYIQKVKRGRYNTVHELVEENPSRLGSGELTIRYVRFLENFIRRNPDMWLWSHRRWKRDWKPEYGKLWIDDPDLHPEKRVEQQHEI